jgi:23S rRNA-/tRNA-specific pseudouridylate synthase
VHVSALGFPIVGDVKYGDRTRDKQFIQSKGLKRLFLHAEKLAFTLPGKKPFSFVAKAEFLDALN